MMNVLDEGFVNQTSIMKILSQVLREKLFQCQKFFIRSKCHAMIKWCMTKSSHN